MRYPFDVRVAVNLVRGGGVALLSRSEHADDKLCLYYESHVHELCLAIRICLASRSIYLHGTKYLLPHYYFY